MWRRRRRINKVKKQAHIYKQYYWNKWSSAPTQREILWREKALARVPPSTLPARTFTDEAVVIMQIILSRDIKTAIQVIEKFVDCCELLAKPENHIKVKSGQYIEREVNLRTEADMVGEKARELIGLPKDTAYAKLCSGKVKCRHVNLGNCRKTRKK